MRYLSKWGKRGNRGVLWCHARRVKGVTGGGRTEIPGYMGLAWSAVMRRKGIIKYLARGG